MNHPIKPKALVTLTIYTPPPLPQDHEPSSGVSLPVDAHQISDGRLDPLDADILRESLEAYNPGRARDILAANKLAESTGREVTLEEWSEWQDRNSWPEGHAGEISGGRRVVVYNGARSFGVKLIGRHGKASRFFVNTFTNPAVKGG